MTKIPYACPGSVDEAIKVLANTPEARPIAGGTDLLVQLQKGAPQPPLLVSLHKVSSLGDIVLEGDTLRIGAGVSLSTLARDEAARSNAPLLSMAAEKMASPPVRSRGTIGGNLCNASPAADLAPPLLVYEAEVVLHSSKGERTLPLSSFLVDAGKTALAPAEIMTSILVPTLPEGTLFGHEKHQVGVCGNLSIISIALALVVDGGTCKEARVALGAVAPTAARYQEVEEKLRGKKLDETSIAAAAALAGRSCSPIDDVRATCDHRCHLVEVMLPKVIAKALAPEA